MEMVHEVLGTSLSGAESSCWGWWEPLRVFNQGSGMKRFAFELEFSGMEWRSRWREGRARGRKTVRKLFIIVLGREGVELQI